LIATGGKDKKVYIWNITDLKKPAFEFDGGSIINAVYNYLLYFLVGFPSLIELGCCCYW